MPFISACAWANDAPSFRRPITSTELGPGLVGVDLGNERHPKLRVEPIMNAGWQDTDYCVWFTIHPDCLLNYVSIRVEGATP